MNRSKVNGRRSRSLSLLANGTAPQRVEDGVAHGRFPKKNLPSQEEIDRVASASSRIELALDEEERIAVTRRQRPRIEVYNRLFDEVIREDKKFNQILRRIKEVYLFELESDKNDKFIDLQTEYECLAIDYKNLKQKFEEVERDNGILRKTVDFRSSQILQLEEIILNMEKDIETLFNGHVDQDPIWKLPKQIEDSIYKLKGDIEERAPAKIQGYSSGAALEIEKLTQKNQQLDAELRKANARERDLYNKYMELKLQTPSFVNNNSTTANTESTSQPAQVQEEPVEAPMMHIGSLLTLAKLRTKLMRVARSKEKLQNTNTE